MTNYSKLAGACVAAIAAIAISQLSAPRLEADNQLISPLGSPTPTPSAVPTPKSTPRVEPSESWEVGVASYYSREGCIGCSPDIRMANGQPLDDSALTVAYNKAKLGARVEIVNQKTLKHVTAIVTDRGGYERHGKIIDMTPATRDAIGCGSTCHVRVRVIGGAK